MSNTTAPLPCPQPGSTTWMLVAAVLVLGMMPGLAFFEAGLLRRRSVLSIITQIFLGLAVMNFFWFLFGFSLVFGPDHAGIIGDFTYGAFVGLRNDCIAEWAPEIPALVYALFQMMFAAITPLLMTGAFAERIRILGFLPLITLWEFLVYYPVAHSIWNSKGLLARLGTLDFAGGIVIHTTAGVAGVTCAMVMGRRQGFDTYHGEFPPHNIPLAAVGAALLFIGWNGFNAGSALGIGFLAVTASANSVLAASSCAMTWGIISLIRNRKRIDPLMVLNGTIAGLAGITPASGYVEPWAAVVIGIILGLASYFSMLLLKGRLRIDDALDVGAVHGVPGIVGAIAIGFFATKEVNPEGANGVFYGDGRQLWVQLVAVLVVSVWTILITLPMILLFRRGHWFSLQPQHEHLGLDGKDHNANAYTQLENEDPSFPHGHHVNIEEK